MTGPNHVEVSGSLTGASNTSDSPVVRRAGRRLIRRAFFLLVVVVALDILVGLIFIRQGRFRGRPVPPYAMTFNESQAAHLAGLGRRRDPYTRFDPELGWSIRPGGVSADGLYRANAAGFRANRNYDLTPPPGVRRVAVFGDSYVHCAGVANDQTWPDLLGSMDTGLEVLNFGVNGYGPDQAYLRYLKDGAKHRPHVVLIGIMVENIMRSVTVYRPAYYHDTSSVSVKPRFRLTDDGALRQIPCPAESVEHLKTLIQSRRLLSTLRETDYWVSRAPTAYEESPLLWSSIWRIVYGSYENARRVPRYHYEHTQCESFRVTAAVLRKFHDRAIKDGATQAVVLFFPNVYTVYGQIEGQSAYWTALLDKLRSSGVPCVDLTPLMVEAVQRFDLDKCFSGNHFSPLGNRIVAQALYTNVLQLP